MFRIIKAFLIFLVTVFSLSTFQWLCVQFLNYFCYDFTLFGIIKNMFTLGSPICNTLNHIQLQLMDNYVLVWVGSVTLFISFVTNLINTKN